MRERWLPGSLSPPPESLGTRLIGASDVFALESDELGTVTDVQHCIETGSNPPVRQPPHQVPFAVRPHMTNVLM